MKTVAALAGEANAAIAAGERHNAPALAVAEAARARRAMRKLAEQGLVRVGDDGLWETTGWPPEA